MWLCFDISGTSTPHKPVFVVARTSCCFVMSSNAAGLVCHALDDVIGLGQGDAEGGCIKPSPCALHLVLMSIHRTSWEYSLLWDYELVAQQPTLYCRKAAQTQIERHSSALWSPRSLLVSADYSHLQMKNWTQRWVRCCFGVKWPLFI